MELIKYLDENEIDYVVVADEKNYSKWLSRPQWDWHYAVT